MRRILRCAVLCWLNRLRWHRFRFLYSFKQYLFNRLLARISRNVPLSATRCGRTFGPAGPGPSPSRASWIDARRARPPGDGCSRRAPLTNANSTSYLISPIHWARLQSGPGSKSQSPPRVLLSLVQAAEVASLVVNLIARSSS
jgi:hypothetical protein